MNHEYETYDTANAVLTADIVVNEGDVAGYDGETTVDWIQWTPIIGWYDDINHVSYNYAGTFDGQNHIISGLYVNGDSPENVGFFGVTANGATVKNVGVINSYFVGQESVGAVSGGNSGTIMNSYSNGTVTAIGDNSSAGGVWI